MKRARIIVNPAPSATRGADLTDRLLGKSEQPARPARQTPAPKRPRSKKMAAPAPAAVSGLPAYTPYRTVEPRPAVVPGPTLPAHAELDLNGATPEALRQALTDTETALAALVAAAQEAPARHDLAVRYRLDALRHHLRQVSEFIASRHK